jgi:phosphohistidine phosphatase SixA
MAKTDQSEPSTDPLTDRYQMVVLRHGEDERVGAGRKLTDGGRRQAHHLGLLLRANIEDQPVLILSSITERARETAQLIAEHFGCDFSMVMYLGEARLLTEVLDGLRLELRRLSDPTVTVIVVAHAPQVALLADTTDTRYCQPHFIELEL